MAINQASFFLFPPRYGPEVKLDHTAKTISGKPLEIVYSTITDPSAPKVLTDEISQWLIERGFSEKEQYGKLRVLYLNHLTTFLGAQEEIKLSVPLDEDEIEELYIRFLLTEHTPIAIQRWRELVVELGNDFGFRLMDGSHRLLPCIDFPTVLAENWNFRDFQKRYGWKIEPNA